MQRRNFLSATIASAAASALARRAAAQTPAATPPVRIGVDVYSLQSQNWTPFQSLDFCSKLGVKVVHFSEIRFLGNLEPDNLTKVRDYAKNLNIDLEIGMKSICPTSTMFEASQGTAEEQLGRMIKAATIIGSPIVRCVLGSSAERNGKIPLEGHIENTIKVLKNIRTRSTDANVKIAIENHAGDMQARELKTLIEGAGRDFVGVCIDSGNPMWTLESPHLTLETLHPYVLTSHVRDTYVWMTPAGVAVRWCRTGEGNIDIDGYIRKYLELCPGRALSAEVIVQPNPRMFAIHDAKFWEPYKTTPAWEYQRFLDLAEKGVPPAGAQAPAAGQGRGGGGRGRGPVSPEVQAHRLATQREDLEVSIQYTKKLLGL
ncbi:MAG TPA: TIM barrel protein [Bryobacteraceae bacterium]|jgi:sugar phosphate isomerase/epimerase